MMSSGNWQHASDWTCLKQKHSIKFERTLSHWFLYFESWAQGQREIISIHPLGLKVLKPNLNTWKLNKSIKIIAGHNSGGYEFIQMRALVRTGMGGCWFGRRSASSSSCPNCGLLFKNQKKSTQEVRMCVIDFFERRVHQAWRKLDILKHVLPSNSPVSPWMMDHLPEST